MLLLELSLGRILWICGMAGSLWAGVSSAPLCAQEKLGPQSMAAKIDKRLQDKWQGVEPAPLADDAEFLRRLFLDLAGRIPRVSEVRTFLEDTSADRRWRAVEQLLESPRYVKHFSATWKNLLLPANVNEPLQLTDFRTWLEEQVRANTPYDRMVREILTTPLPDNGRDLRRGSQALPTPPAAFFLANERKAENLAASTARIFLGVKLECAQCHDHPQARWTRAQFWELAAFFPPLEEPGGLRPTARQIRIAGTDKVVSAKLLTGQEPAWSDGEEPRIALARWLTAADNPYFARTAVNRLWAHFFGVGLIDPVDDEPTDDNPVSHPELLAELTGQFVAHDFDIQYLIRTITATKAYQRTSARTHKSQDDLRVFARMAVRGLTAEQLFDSIALATGFREKTSGPAASFLDLANITSERGNFVNRFASQERVTEKQVSILQALALMNGKFVADATSLDKSTTLAAVVDTPFMTSKQKIETLYLAALSRQPRADELRRLTVYIESTSEPRKALGDVFWALLNSSEFILNH